MPAMPEIGYTIGLIRRIEVNRESESQQQGKTYRHITIPRKVAINLQGITIDTHQIFQPRVQARIIKDTLYEIHTDIIGYDSLFE